MGSSSWERWEPKGSQAAVSPLLRSVTASGWLELFLPDGTYPPFAADGVCTHSRLLLPSGPPFRCWSGWGRAQLVPIKPSLLTAQTEGRTSRASRHVAVYVGGDPTAWIRTWDCVSGLVQTGYCVLQLAYKPITPSHIP